jgi:lipoprotein signal peptidase
MNINIEEVLKKAFNYFINKFEATKTKIILVIAFIVLFTGSDLAVKQIIFKKLKGKPDIVLVKDYISFHFQANDDLGFSALRWINKYFQVPKKINKNTFEKRVIPGLENQYEKTLIKQFYFLNEDSKYYQIRNDMDGYNTNLVLMMLSNSGYRTSKWLFLVMLQGIGSLIIILFYFYVKELKYLLPLLIIIGGALGNLTSRIIYGNVIDFIMCSFKFIHMQLFNPFPIFNLADTFITTGTVVLLIVFIFFSNSKKSFNVN